jgi:hypothetical protein
MVLPIRVPSVFDLWLMELFWPSAVSANERAAQDNARAAISRRNWAPSN